jgi:hypothetical protein
MSARCKLRHMQCSESIAIYWGISSCTSLGRRSSAHCRNSQRRWRRNLESPVRDMWNECGTNRGRIAYSRAIRFRSRRPIASQWILNTRSWGIRLRVQRLSLHQHLSLSHNHNSATSQGLGLVDNGTNTSAAPDASQQIATIRCV